MTAKIMKKNQQDTFHQLRSNGGSPVFLLRDLDLNVQFQIFLICEVRSFLYVTGHLKLWKKNQQHIQTFAIERRKHLFLFRDLGLLTLLRSKIKNFIFSETVTTSANILYNFKYLSYQQYFRFLKWKWSLSCSFRFASTCTVYGTRRQVALVEKRYWVLKGTN